MNTIRDGLNYKVFWTGKDCFRIGAVIDESKVVHSGNLHFLPGLYDTREEADAGLVKALENKIIALLEDKE